MLIIKKLKFILFFSFLLSITPPAYYNSNSNNTIKFINILFLMYRYCVTLIFQLLAAFHIYYTCTEISNIDLHSYIGNISIILYTIFLYLEHILVTLDFLRKSLIHNILLKSINNLYENIIKNYNKNPNLNEKKSLLLLICYITFFICIAINQIYFKSYVPTKYDIYFMLLHFYLSTVFTIYLFYISKIASIICKLFAIINERISSVDVKTLSQTNFLLHDASENVYKIIRIFNNYIKSTILLYFIGLIILITTRIYFSYIRFILMTKSIYFFIRNLIWYIPILINFLNATNECTSIMFQVSILLYYYMHIIICKYESIHLL